MNLANKITIFRILLVPFFISFVLYSKWNIALIIFVMAVVSDGIDGYIARTANQKTVLGKILDPLADKLLILSAFICISVVKGLPSALKPPAYVPIVVISRDAIIVLGAFLIYLMKGSMEVNPTIVGKVTTFFQMITVISILLRLTFSPILWNITIGISVISGIDYIIRGSRLLNGK